MIKKIRLCIDNDSTIIQYSAIQHNANDPRCSQCASRDPQELTKQLAEKILGR